MIPRPRKAALSESRIAAGPSPRCANHSAIGGPLTPADVLSAPVAKPSASRARGSPGVGAAASRRALARSAAAPMTATPTAICSTDLGSARRISTPHTAPGMEATRSGPTSPHATRGRRCSPNSTSPLSASPSTVMATTALSGSSSANTAGLSTSANPRPVAACTTAATSATTARRSIYRRSVSSRLRTLPVALRGSSSRNSISRGTL